ncbi:response regulator [Gordonia sp. NPDC003422]
MPDASGRSARIGIVDDHGQIVRGLTATLADHPEFAVAATGATVAELLAEATDLDLVLLDLRLDDESSPGDNIEALRAAGIPALVYTSGDEVYLMRQAAAAGVLGVVRKNARDAELFDAIREALAGRPVPSADWAAAIESDPDFVDLPPQLRRVLELYAAGESNARVASSLGLSVETISDYVTRIRLKYSEAGRPAPTKTDLLKRAIEDGWLPIPRRRKRR